MIGRGNGHGEVQVDVMGCLERLDCRHPPEIRQICLAGGVHVGRAQEEAVGPSRPDSGIGPLHAIPNVVGGEVGRSISRDVRCVVGPRNIRRTIGGVVGNNIGHVICSNVRGVIGAGVVGYVIGCIIGTRDIGRDVRRIVRRTIGRHIGGAIGRVIGARVIRCAIGRVVGCDVRGVVGAGVVGRVVSRVIGTCDIGRHIGRAVRGVVSRIIGTRDIGHIVRAIRHPEGRKFGAFIRDAVVGRNVCRVIGRVIRCEIGGDVGSTIGRVVGGTIRRVICTRVIGGVVGGTVGRVVRGVVRAGVIGRDVGGRISHVIRPHIGRIIGGTIGRVIGGAIGRIIGTSIVRNKIRRRIRRHVCGAIRSTIGRDIGGVVGVEVRCKVGIDGGDIARVITTRIIEAIGPVDIIRHGVALTGRPWQCAVCADSDTSSYFSRIGIVPSTGVIFEVDNSLNTIGEIRPAGLNATVAEAFGIGVILIQVKAQGTRIGSRCGGNGEIRVGAEIHVVAQDG